MSTPAYAGKDPSMRTEFTHIERMGLQCEIASRILPEVGDPTSDFCIRQAVGIAQRIIKTVEEDYNKLMESKK